jgi:hypothetical protein
MSNELIKFPSQLPGIITSTGWQLPENLSFEEWLEWGRLLYRGHSSTQWAIGDWWAYGVDRKYGDGYFR